ncbi:leucyl/phenylalanyl-tRNA--protein transferase [Natronospira proteinivora]|uniref:Leucyl/phenylalanyl-tRNA--protein transferase n=1 Tax=Natronospira proteinivora TaxID=1807133 RepID=A0ABT1G702_9GAMM|nr:leucyl/phenylalanyl-tRNA--protein transferase [Natronospira proteinivora]MCP1726730.1 leucyl/phenylalanyl-tRNA--protein transferase [Natronospira proteinivora]
MTQLPWIPKGAPAEFPDPSQALEEPNGLLAAGGDLSPERLLAAYRQGIFPWFDDRNPILWWSPDPRLVIEPGQLHISRRLRRTLRQQNYRVSLDQAFESVIHACADVDLRPDQGGTWITPAMIEAYTRLHQRGHAHSIEVWMDGELAGGLYGISLGRVFFGESMFSRRRDGSKIAMAWLDAQLAAWQFELMDCQVSSPHLLRMGAREIPRQTFLRRVSMAIGSGGLAPTDQGHWPLQHRPSCL